METGNKLLVVRPTLKTKWTAVKTRTVVDTVRSLGNALSKVFLTNKKKMAMSL